MWIAIGICLLAFRVPWSCVIFAITQRAFSDPTQILHQRNNSCALLSRMLIAGPTILANDPLQWAAPAYGVLWPWQAICNNWMTAG
jgi:hypothetical protein